MRTIILISCVSKKQLHKAIARELYTSPLFRYALRYAESLHPDKIYILSAKYGLVSLDTLIAPYDVTLNTMTAPVIRQWSKDVLSALAQVADLEHDRFIFLAGEKYRKYLIPEIRNYEIPLEGLGIGKQLHYYKEHI